MTSTLVVDGSNIATEGRTLPSLAQLDEAVTAIIAEHPHNTIVVVVDATFGHRIDKSEVERFEEAVLDGDLVTPPAGAIGRGDAFILQIADKAKATIFSNDSFQEFHGTYPWLFDEGRLLGGKPVPGIGWVFVARSPVRGPLSRRSVRDAKKSPGRAPAKASARSTRAADESEAPTRRPRRQPKDGPPVIGDVGIVLDPATAVEKAARARPKKGTAAVPSQNAKKLPPINEPLPFLNFVSNHTIGSIVSGQVIEFSSHGAYVTVDGARGYVPLKSMGDPPPRSAREVLTIGETRAFVVERVDTPRRGIDLHLEAELPTGDGTNGEMVEVPPEHEDQLIENSSIHQPAEEAALAAVKKKAPAKKAPAKKAPAKKAPAKKAPAKKAPAKKAPAKKAPAKRAPAKKAPAKKR